MLNLDELTDEQLFVEAVAVVWEGAKGEANGGDHDTFVRAMQFKVESDKRLVAAGHSRACLSGIYSRAYEHAIAKHQRREPREVTCTCGAVNA
jgi:hypothetical protein